MPTTVTLDFASLRKNLAEQVNEYWSGVREDLKKDLAGEVERILERSAVLGERALQGDPVAIENLRDLRAQAIAVACVVEMREADRLLNTAQLIAVTVIRTLINAALGL